MRFFKKKTLIKCISLGSFLLVLGFCYLAGAANNPGGNVYNLYPFKKALLLNSPVNQELTWFEVRPGVNLADKCFINIVYSHSDTLLYDQSLITVELNGLPLASRRFSEHDVKPTEWQVALPLEKIQGGFNEISITTRQRTIEGQCKDIDNDANWVLIHDKSILHLETTGQGDVQLKEYPYPFLNYLSSQPVNSTWHLPENPGPEEIKAMLQMAYDWAKRTQTRVLPIKVKIGKPEQDGGNHILIGELKHWPGLLGVDSGEGTGILSLSRDEKNGNTFLVSGADAEGLEKTQAVLSSPEMISQLESNPFLIKDLPQGQQQKKPVGRPGLYTFSDLGYQDITLSGAYHQRTSIVVQRPQGWSIGRSAYVEVHFRHSAGLDPYKSALTLYVNGQPVKSTVLNAGNAENGVLKASIPVEELSKPEWAVELNFYHDIGTADCSKRYDDVAWSVIEANSLVYLAPGKMKNEPALDSFPLITGAERETRSNVTLWLSANPSEQELSLAALIATRAAQNSNVTIDWQVVTGEKPDEKYLTDNIIMICYQNEWERLAGLKDHLPVLPESRGGYAVMQGINFISDGSEGAALIEVAASPWNKQKVLYAVVGVDDASFERVCRVLSDVDLSEQVKGQVTVVSGNGQVKSLKMHGTEEAEKQSAWEKDFNTVLVDHNILKIYLALVFLVLTVVALTLWIARKRSR